MKVAVIGTGKMGRIHCRILKELGVLAGVYDLDQMTSHSVAKEYGVESFKFIPEILGNSGINAVTIATPTPTHLETAANCISAGKDVLLEKPMCASLDEAEELVNLVKEKDQIVTVGYIERYNPAFKDLLNRVRTKICSVGQITSVNIKRVGGIPRSADNVVMDIMTHDINLLIALFQRTPKEVHVHRRESGDIVHSAQALLDFGTASATCEANWVSPMKMRTIAVTGTEGYLEVDMIKQHVTQFFAHGITSLFLNEEPLMNEMKAFLKAVETRDTSQIVTIDEAYQTLKVTVEAAYGEIR
jgi:UDP-N-acetylglucosamine 3-dehydrogenase